MWVKLKRGVLHVKNSWYISYTYILFLHFCGAKWSLTTTNRRLVAMFCCIYQAIIYTLYCCDSSNDWILINKMETPKKKKKLSKPTECIIHCFNSSDALVTMDSYASWQTLLKAAQIRSRTKIGNRTTCRSLFTMNSWSKEAAE